MTVDRIWKPMSDLSINPNETTYINVRTEWTYRWLPYKKDGRRQMKAQGRWQRATEYGYENCSQPAGEWTPNVPKDVA